MSKRTEADRETAAELYLGCRKTAYHRKEATAAIAAALAAERAKARAPFLALIGKLAHIAEPPSVNGYDAGFASGVTFAADRIRHAAEHPS